MTKKINEISNLMSDPCNVDIIKERTRELKQYVCGFQNAHEAYHVQLRDEGEIFESTRYYNAALDMVSDLEHRIDLWNTELEARDLMPDLQLEPEDSVSNTGSYSASRVSRRLSVSSQYSAKTTNHYKTEPQDYLTLVNKNVTKAYKKTDPNVPKKISSKDKQIAELLRLDEVSACRDSFITLK